MFLSAALLFAVQPMAGKTVLPLAGGTPAVWTTCLVFFQATLLLGYLYADRVASLPARLQTVCHGLVLVGALLVLQWLQPDRSQYDADAEFPVLGLVLFLAGLVGAPFFALSATAPIFQRWLTATGHRSGRDPYFLYAASNAGSFVGLLAYPFLIEPRFSLPAQNDGWRLVYVVFIALSGICAVTVWLGQTPGRFVAPEDSERDGELRSPGWRELGRWMVLGALPASLLMSVTQHLSTDVAPVPLLWVIPLGLYLLTFVITFGYWPAWVRRLTARLMPMVLVILAFTLRMNATEPLLLVASVHLFGFFALTLYCHGELAASRPDGRFLTRFYLAMSFGGVVGGLFNAVVAPLLFSGLYEYPLGLVAVAGLLILYSPSAKPFRRIDLVLVLAFVGLSFGLMALALRLVPIDFRQSSSDTLIPRAIQGGLGIGIPAIAAFALSGQRLRFTLILAGFFAVGLFASSNGEVLLRSRNFFGPLKVLRFVEEDRTIHRLVHGTTLHGEEWVSDTGLPVPRFYYYPSGPVGRLLEKLPEERRRRVAVVGLGSGAMAAYARPGEEWTFYEIDPSIARIAQNPAYFTYLQKCQADWRIVLGDARRQLEQVPDRSIDLLALDAFSSDAIPVHLLTREALELYARKLAPEGVMVFHVSNRYLNLPPMLARLAASLEPSWQCRLDEDWATDKERDQGKLPSQWVLVYRRPDDLGDAAADLRWQPLSASEGPVWTDDFSNLLTVWRKMEP